MTLLQDSRPFINQRVYRTLDDLFGRNRSPDCAAFARGAFDERLHFRIVLRVSSFVVTVPPGAFFLAKPALCAEHFHDTWLAAARRFECGEHVPAAHRDIDARKILSSEGSH